MGPGVSGVEGEGLLPMGPEGLGVWWGQEPGQTVSRAEPVSIWTLDHVWGAASRGALPALLAARAWASMMRVHPSNLCPGS